MEVGPMVKILKIVPPPFKESCQLNSCCIIMKMSVFLYHQFRKKGNMSNMSNMSRAPENGNYDKPLFWTNHILLEK